MRSPLRAALLLGTPLVTFALHEALKGFMLLVSELKHPI